MSATEEREPLFLGGRDDEGDGKLRKKEKGDAVEDCFNGCCSRVVRFIAFSLYE
jgi:hypothetical protein